MKSYKRCNYSDDGKCMHFYSEGELKCNGTKDEQGNCLIYNEADN